MTETWRPIAGYERMYEVSSEGRVKSVDRYVAHACGGVRLMQGKMMKQARAGKDYSSVCLSINGKQKTRYVHQLVAEAFLVGGGECVRHLDGNKRNNSAANLSYGSYADNERDKDRHGTRPVGERNHFSKLTASDIVEIRRAVKAGAGISPTARRYLVSASTVIDIARRRSWRHVRDESAEIEREAA